MLTLNTKVLAALLLLVPAYCAADDKVTQEWGQLIKADFPPGCIVRLDEYLSLTTINGSRGGSWLVQTCEGNYEYSTRYSPPDMRSNNAPISVSRKRKLDDLTPVQLKRMYSLPD